MQISFPLPKKVRPVRPNLFLYKLRVLLFMGKPDYPQKANFPILSPFLPKIKQGCSFKEIYSLEAFSIYPLNSRIPLFSRLSLSYRSNKKRPHRKDCFLSTRPFTCFLFSFGATLNCLHRIFGCASGYGEIDLVGVL